MSAGTPQVVALGPRGHGDTARGLLLSTSMKKAVRMLLSFVGTGALMLAVDAISRRRRGALLRKLLGVIRPLPVDDGTVRARVRSKLEQTAERAASIAISVEHGCVELRGPIGTHERARVVREVARVKGVDAVVDLMTEPAPPLVRSTA